MTFEYKTVGAPEKGKRKRGARSKSDRVAAAFEEILKAEAVDGWDYQRTDLVPVIERAGWFSRAKEIHRAVMVFRRPIEPTRRDRGEMPRFESDPKPRRSPPEVSAPAPTLAPAPAPAPPLAPAQEPAVSEDPDLRLAEYLRAPSSPRPPE